MYTFFRCFGWNNAHLVPRLLQTWNKNRKITFRQKPELSLTMYGKPLKTDRMYYAMITDRETSAVSLTAPSCGCSGDDCRRTEVHIPQLLPLSAALCFALTGETMYSRGWSFLWFIFLTELYCVGFILCLCRLHEIILEHWTSKGPINPTKAV